tara:strand:- start:1436 stop:1972 length:537 start_codon:yes stop_codon:yes gene_type:complete
VRKYLLNINILYLCFISAFGIYGQFFALFEPTEKTVYFSKLLSVLFLAYFLFVSLYFFIRNKAKYEHKFKSKRHANVFIYLGLPFIFLVLSLVNYSALSKGLPTLINSLVSDGIYKVVTVEKKRLWGRKKRQEELYITGYNSGFPITRAQYNRLKVGQEVSIIVYESVLGTKIEITQP